MPTPQNSDVEEFDVEDTDQDVESLEDDETLDDDDTNDDTDADDNDEDDTEDTDDDSDEDEDQPKAGKFEKRYSQFKGKTPEEYAKSLEEGYHNSSAEAVKLNRELTELKQKTANLLAAAEKNPELAKQLGLEESDTSASTTKSPAETYAEQMMNERMEKEYKEFTTIHPEVDTDKALSDELLAEVAVQSKAYYERHGKIISMADALNRSWKVLGYDDNSKEKLAVKLKDNAAQGTTQGASTKKKSTAKTEVSPKALDYAKKMGLSEKDIQKYYKA